MQQKKSSCFLPLNLFNRKKLCSLLEQLIEPSNAQATFNARGTVAAASIVLMKTVPDFSLLNIENFSKEFLFIPLKE